MVNTPTQQLSTRSMYALCSGSEDVVTAPPLLDDPPSLSAVISAVVVMVRAADPGVTLPVSCAQCCSGLRVWSGPQVRVLVVREEEEVVVRSGSMGPWLRLVSSTSPMICTTAPPPGIGTSKC